MNKILQNVLAILAGIIIGASVNMGIIVISPSIIPPPDGVDVSSMESLVANIHLFEPEQFIMPFVAHTFGTFAGAFFTAAIAKSFRMGFALIIGSLFLIGGIMNVVMLPSPLWFNVFDLVIAYMPMSYLAFRLSLLVKSGSKN